jgi:hypothetical protein
VFQTYLLSFHILAHSLARRKTQLFYSQAILHSLPKNTRGGGSAHPLGQCGQGVSHPR